MLTISNYLGFILSNICILGGFLMVLHGWLKAPRRWMSFPAAITATRPGYVKHSY